MRSAKTYIGEGEGYQDQLVEQCQAEVEEEVQTKPEGRRVKEAFFEVGRDARARLSITG